MVQHRSPLGRCLPALRWQAVVQVIADVGTDGSTLKVTGPSGDVLAVVGDKASSVSSVSWVAASMKLARGLPFTHSAGYIGARLPRGVMPQHRPVLRAIDCFKSSWQNGFRKSGKPQS